MIASPMLIWYFWSIFIYWYCGFLCLEKLHIYVVCVSFIYIVFVHFI